MGLILIPLKSVAKLQLSSTVEGLVPIWHQFQHQKSPCWRLWGVYWQTGLSSKKKEIHQDWTTSMDHPSFDKMPIKRLFPRWYFSVKNNGNNQVYGGLGVHPGARARGSRSLSWGTATGDLKGHCYFPGKKPLGFWPCWIPVALALANWKTFVPLWAQVPTCTEAEDTGAGRRSVSSLVLGSSQGKRLRRTQEHSQKFLRCNPHTWQQDEPFTVAASYCEEGKPSKAALCWNLETSSLAETLSQLDAKTSARARKNTAVPGEELCVLQVISKQYLQSLPALQRNKPHVSNVFWQLSVSFPHVPQGSWYYCFLGRATIPKTFWISWKLVGQIPAVKAEDHFRVNIHIKSENLKAEDFQTIVCNPK